MHVWVELGQIRVDALAVAGPNLTREVSPFATHGLLGAIVLFVESHRKGD